MLPIPAAQELMAPQLPPSLPTIFPLHGSISPLPTVLLSPVRSPQVCAFHVLQTLVRGAGLGGALLRHAAPMVALALRGLGSPCWAMRNAAIQLFSKYQGGEARDPCRTDAAPGVWSLARAKHGGLGRG